MNFETCMPEVSSFLETNLESFVLFFSLIHITPFLQQLREVFLFQIEIYYELVN